MPKKLLCVKCGKNARYEHDGRVFGLCASCAWISLQALLSGEIEQTDKCPRCNGRGYYTDGYDNDLKCPKCDGKGRF